MVFILLYIAVIVIFTVPQLIKRRRLNEIAAVAVITAFGIYYAILFAESEEGFSPVAALLKWLDIGVGLSYTKLIGSV